MLADRARARSRFAIGIERAFLWAVLVDVHVRDGQLTVWWPQIDQPVAKFTADGVAFFLRDGNDRPMPYRTVFESIAPYTQKLMAMVDPAN